jgi:hypothetical protein
MSRQLKVKDPARLSDGNEARGRLLAGLPATERRLRLAGASTTLLEGGEGPPMVLLTVAAGAKISSHASCRPRTSIRSAPGVSSVYDSAVPSIA